MMSTQPPTPDSDHRARDYLRRALAYDPWRSAGEIVALRERFLGLARAASQPRRETADQLEARRQAGGKALKRIREGFYSAEIGELRAWLEGVDSTGLPEIRSDLNRLRCLAENRQRLLDWAGARRGDRQFGHDVLYILRSDRQQSVARRQSAEAEMTWRRRWRSKAMLRRLRSEIPQVYRLEENWFFRFLHDQKTSGTVEATEPAKRVSWWTWWLILFGLSSFLRSFGQFFRDQ